MVGTRYASLVQSIHNHYTVTLHTSPDRIDIDLDSFICLSSFDLELSLQTVRGLGSITNLDPFLSDQINSVQVQPMANLDAPSSLTR